MKFTEWTSSGEMRHPVYLGTRTDKQAKDVMREREQPGRGAGRPGRGERLMPKADGQTVAKLLREYAQRTALRGGNPYRAKAYSRAADSLTALPEPLDKLVQEDRLTDIPGVGEAIADIVKTLYRTGTHPSLEKLRKDVPTGVLELLTIPGPDRTECSGSTRIWASRLSRSSRRQPRTTASRKRRGSAPHCRPKFCKTWRLPKAALAGSTSTRQRPTSPRCRSLQASRPNLKRITVAGDFRRGCELVGDLSIVAEAPSSAGASAAPSQGGLRVHVSDPKHFGAALLFATGSAAHLKGLQKLADAKGMGLSPDGLRKGRSLIGAEEKDIYRALGLSFIDPELREGRGEIDRALGGRLRSS